MMAGPINRRRKKVDWRAEEGNGWKRGKYFAAADWVRVRRRR
jgi:hypothetical protein